MNPISQVVPGALAALLRSGPMSPGKVDLAWKTAVGDAIARATAVRLEGGVLLVDAASREWAREVNRASGVILARLQHLLGSDRVTGLQVRVQRS